MRNDQRDVDFLYQLPPENDGIKLNNSCILLSELACNLYDIYKTKFSKEWMHQDRWNTYTAQDEIERFRCPDLSGPEVLSNHNSTMAPQQERAKVMAHDLLTFMQAYSPNGPSPSIFNSNSTTEQQPTSLKYDLHLPPGEHGIDLNNQFILPSELTYDAHGIYSSERLMNAGGYEINPLCNETKSLRDEIERHRYPNLPGPEVLNTHDSSNYDQDAEMQNAPQQEHAQAVAHSALAPGSLPQTQTSNAFDQTIQISAPSFAQVPVPEPMQMIPHSRTMPNPRTTPYSETDDFHSWMSEKITNFQTERKKKFRQPGGPRLIKVITDEEIDGLRKLKTKEDRRKRTENPDTKHRKEVRKAGSKAHHERNSNEIKELNSMKQRLEESIKIKESLRVERVNLYNETQKKEVLKMNWTINTLNNLRYNIPPQLDSTLEEWTNRSVDRMNYFLSNNTRLFIHNYLLSDERDTNSQIELESGEDLLNDLTNIEEGLKQLKMEKKKIKEQLYKLEVDKLYSRKHRKSKALERIRLRNENKRLKSKDDKIGKDLIEIESRLKSLSIDADDVLREGIDCICRWIKQYQQINYPLPQDTI